jgi:hypothetical protein
VHPDPDGSTVTTADVLTSLPEPTGRASPIIDSSAPVSSSEAASSPVFVDVVEPLPVSSFPAGGAEQVMSGKKPRETGFEESHPFALETELADRPGSRGSNGSGRKKYVLTEEVQMKQGGALSSAE